MKLRLAARGSALSRAQVELVRRALAGSAEIEVLELVTTGDRLSHIDAAITGKGVFTKEIDQALLEGRADIGVHSLKDLPAELPAGLELAAVPPREDASDVLIAHPHRTFAGLPPGSRIGTGSPRRRAQILATRADLQVLEARGNVDTRIRHLKEGRWDAIVLACAGLARLARLEEVSEVFSTEVMIPAIGQGALALVARRGDAPVAQKLEPLDHLDTHRAVLAERALLRRLEAGCRAPLAGHARIQNGTMILWAAVFSLNGDRMLRDQAVGPAHDAELLGDRLALALLSRGAGDLISEARA